MPLPDIVGGAGQALKATRGAIADLLTPTVRLGVTGLARSGKTVFITALVHNLVSGGRLPFFAAHAERRIIKAYLEPQPDDAVPRFDYEGHLAMLRGDPPRWPDSTRRIAELRVTIEYEPASGLRRAIGPARLHLDIVDYPGEWLGDLALLEQSYAEWAAAAVDRARERGGTARPFLEFLARAGDDPRTPEQVAIEGAGRFTAYLKIARESEPGGSLEGPGRFLMPGDLDGSPMLTFFPLHADTNVANDLVALLERRFESYKTHVVKPFFRDHFARIDRQIVLADALGSVDAGPLALAHLEATLASVLRVFRPGARSWLASLLGRRIDRLVFAATKADHLHHTSHDRLEAILARLTERAAKRAASAGAEVKVMVLAAMRATREAEARIDGERLACIVGVPLPGQTLGGTRLDSEREAAIFPGDLPADPGAAFDGSWVPRGEVSVIRFRPPRLAAPGPWGEPAPVPHIRLDRALDFLIGDRLA